jgi:uncharacterized protein (DUF2164 family)
MISILGVEGFVPGPKEASNEVGEILSEGFVWIEARKKVFYNQGLEGNTDELSRNSSDMRVVLWFFELVVPRVPLSGSKLKNMFFLQRRQL